MRNIDPLVLASYYRPVIYCVMFVDGVEVRVWASNPGQANLLAIKRRQADAPGKYFVSNTVIGVQ